MLKLRVPLRCLAAWQGDLWDDAAEALTRMFGARIGNCCAATFEIAAGETDLVANRIEGQKPNPAEIFATRKRRLITSRMIASQAVPPVPRARTTQPPVYDERNVGPPSGCVGVSCNCKLSAGGRGYLGLGQRRGYCAYGPASHSAGYDRVRLRRVRMRLRRRGCRG
jgi:hypothetical protein